MAARAVLRAGVAALALVELGFGPWASCSRAAVDGRPGVVRHDRPRAAGARARGDGDPGVEGVVLRYGWLYGPGTWFAPAGLAARLVRRRLLPPVGDGGGLVSRLHVEDAARAAVAALGAGAPGICNVVDDTPVAYRQWLPEYARLLEAPGRSACRPGPPAGS